MDYNALASGETVTRTAEALKTKNIEPIMLEKSADALTKIKELIPAGASVMNGSSRTLEQIGFVEYLKAGNHGWNNLHEAVFAEKDRAKQAAARKKALLSDYYLGSVHALAETGEFIVASNTGSQLPHIAFSSANLIFVVSTKKIVPALAEALRRLEEHVIPLEDKRMKELFGVGTSLNKIITFRNENPMLGRKVRMLLVNENLGF